MSRVPSGRALLGASAAAALTLTVAACGSSKPAASAAPGAATNAAAAPRSGGSSGAKGKTYDVVVGAVGNPYYVKAAQAIEAEAKALGVSANFTGAQDFTQPEQTTVLNTLLANKPAGLVIAPVDPTGVVPALKPWVSAKIPIATFDSTISGPIPVVTRIATQNYNGGVAAAKALAKSIGGSGEVGIIGLNTADVVLSDRQAGFVHELKVAYPNVKVVDKLLVGSNSSSIAQSDAQSLVNKFSGLKAIFCTYNVATEAAAVGVQQLGDSGKVQLAGFDGDQTLYSLVKRNVVQVLVQQQPAAEATGALKYLVMHKEGKPVPKTYAYPMVVVTPANVAAMSKYMY